MKKKTSALPVEQAQRIIREAVLPLGTTESVPLKAAFFRVLAEDITSRIDVPFQDNAAMDGYAFSATDLDLKSEQTLKITGSAFAGHHFEGIVAKGECVQIMTGGAMPDGCDTVVQQENVTISDTTIAIPAASIATGENVRLRGEDVKVGETCLKAGSLLKPAHIGLLASLGLAEVQVRKRPKVAIFSTGDELCPVSSPLPPGGIYDSNRYSLYGMIKRLGCDVWDMGIVKDDPALIRAAFIKAAKEADAIITTGGVSVGAADHTRDVLSRLAKIAFSEVNMRPGRPMVFGQIHSDERQTCVFALPGNPVAVMTTFYFFVRDALCYLMGTRAPLLPRMQVKTLSPLAKRLGRTEFQRGILSPTEHGDWAVRSTGPQGSAMLSSMTQANCVIVLPADRDAAETGEKVEVVLFDGLV